MHGPRRRHEKTLDGGRTWRTIRIRLARRAISLATLDDRHPWMTAIEATETLLATRDAGMGVPSPGAPGRTARRRRRSPRAAPS